MHDTNAASTTVLADACSILVALAMERPTAVGFAASFAGASERARAENLLAVLANNACGGEAVAGGPRVLLPSDK